VSCRTRSRGPNDAGLTSDQQVCYRVIAYNLSGDAPPSNTDCTVPPTAPTDLVGTLREDGAVEPSWSGNSAVEEGYEMWVQITLTNIDCDAGCTTDTYDVLVGDLLPTRAASRATSAAARRPTLKRRRTAGSPTCPISSRFLNRRVGQEPRVRQSWWPPWTKRDGRRSSHRAFSCRPARRHDQWVSRHLDQSGVPHRLRQLAHGPPVPGLGTPQGT
jgi:hypothetical protein